MVILSNVEWYGRDIRDVRAVDFVCPELGTNVDFQCLETN